MPVGTAAKLFVTVAFALNVVNCSVITFVWDALASAVNEVSRSVITLVCAVLASAENVESCVSVIVVVKFVDAIFIATEICAQLPDVNDQVSVIFEPVATISPSAAPLVAAVPNVDVCATL